MTDAPSITEVGTFIPQVEVTSGENVDALKETISEQQKQIVELRRQLEIAKTEAIYDPKLEILNRRGMERAYRNELARVARGNQALLVVEIDIDHFKDVNDRFGHPFGDGILRELSDKASTAIRETDSFGRWGGEEFYLLLPVMENKADLQEMMIILKRIQDETHTINRNNTRAEFSPLTVSMGCVLIHPPAEFTPGLNIDQKEIDDKVDKNLYTSKINRDSTTASEIWFDENGQMVNQIALAGVHL